MNKTSSVDQDFRLWVLLHQTRDAIFKAREKELKPYGITTMECGVLFIVEAVGYKATPAEISRWLYREPHSVSVLLSRMEKKGLIKKTKDLERKNLIRISLTEKGKQAHISCTKLKSVHNIVSTLSKEEYRQMASYLGKLRDSALKENGIEEGLPFP